jgi:hypothetical protein
MLSMRLAPLLPELVSPNQSAFMQKRFIQENFLHVQGMIKGMHHDKTSGFFLKLDIMKTFDSVIWSFLLDLLEVLGFRERWRRWICLLLSSATHRVLLNGKPGPRIVHHRGLQQGDPWDPDALHFGDRSTSPSVQGGIGGWHSTTFPSGFGAVRCLPIRR